MIHTNVPNNNRPKAQMRATGEIIRKNGKKEPFVMLADPNMTQEELLEERRLEIEEQNNQDKEVN